MAKLDKRIELAEKNLRGCPDIMKRFHQGRCHEGPKVRSCEPFIRNGSISDFV